MLSLIPWFSFILFQAGLAAIDTKFDHGDFFNKPDEVSKILAEQKPNWEPGTTLGYHGWTLVPYIDQLVRRVDPLHRDLSDYFEDEIARKFGNLPKSFVYSCSLSRGCFLP